MNKKLLSLLILPFLILGCWESKDSGSDAEQTVESEEIEPMPGLPDEALPQITDPTVGGEDDNGQASESESAEENKNPEGDSDSDPQ